MPTDRVAWRVIRDTAQVPGEAPSLERALGFVLAVDDALLVTDVDTGVQQRLAAAEAAFVPEGVFQRHESLGNGPAPYFRLALVPPEDADYTAGGELVLAGNGFAAPEGRRDLDLILGNLRSGATATLNDSGFPTVILALTGGLSVGVAEGGGGPTALAAGEAMVVQGNRELKATGPNGAIFVAAVIGPALDIPTAPPIELGGNGPGEQLHQIDVWVYDCPPDVSYQDLTVAFPSPVCTVDFDATFASLLSDNLPGGELTLADLQSDEGDLTWFVPAGEYVRATDNSVQVIVEPAGALGEVTGNTATLWPLTIDDEHPYLVLGIFQLH
jgi:hypothetical protein